WCHSKRTRTWACWYSPATIRSASSRGKAACSWRWRRSWWPPPCARAWDDVTLAQEIDAYLERLRSIRRTSPNTVSGRRRDLQRFAEYCRQAGVGSAGEVDAHGVRGYVAWLRQKKRGPATLRRHLSSLRG